MPSVPLAFLPLTSKRRSLTKLQSLQEFWRRYEVLPFSRSPEKYMRINPDMLVDIIQSQLLQSMGTKDPHALDISVRLDGPGSSKSLG